MLPGCLASASKLCVGAGDNVQPSHGAVDLLSCPGGAMEWAPRPKEHIGWDLKPGRLKTELPGQTGSPAWL